MLTKLMQRAVKKNPKCAAYVNDKNVTFQIQTASGEGRYFEVKNGKINSYSGLTKSPSFIFTFKTASKGFAVLSAKDNVNTFSFKTILNCVREDHDSTTIRNQSLESAFNVAKWL